MDAEQIRKQAKDENTAPEILAELANSEDKLTRQYIASNPNTPEKTLEKLCIEFPDAVVANPIFALLLLENPESRLVLMTVAGASTTSIKKLEELSEHQSRSVVAATVINPITPGIIIDNIYNNCKHYLPCKLFLRNKNTEDITLEKIIIKTGTQDKDISDLIINHPNASLNTVNAVKMCNYCPDVTPFVLQRWFNLENKAILRIIVGHPNVNGEILKELSIKGDKEIRRSVAKHPKISQNVLHSLAINDSKDNHDIRCIIAERKDISEETIITLIGNFLSRDYRSCDINEKLARNPVVKKSVIDNLIKDEHHRVRAAVAEREDISEQQAMMLVYDTSSYVRKSLAANPHISPTISKLLSTVNKARQPQEYLESWRKSSTARNELRKLLVSNGKQIERKSGSYYKYFKDELSDIIVPKNSIERTKELIQNVETSHLLGFIYNSNTPSEILDYLAANNSYLIRQGVAEHPNTSIETLSKLKTDENINVREKVAANSNISQEIIKELAQDSMAAVRQAIVNNPQTTTVILNELKSDRSDCVRGAIAIREDISEEIAVALANDASAYVRQRLVCNLNVPVEIIELLSKEINLISKDGNGLVQIEIIKNIDLSPKLFENLALSSSAKVRQEVSRHPKVPMSILDLLKTDEDKYVRVEVAKNPNISSEIMEYLAKDSINSKPTNFARRNPFRVGTDYHHQVRLAIAKRTDITEKAASILAKDPLPQVRQTVAGNINVPLNIIMSLCDDSNRKVQDEALKMFVDR